MASANIAGVRGGRDMGTSFKRLARHYYLTPNEIKESFGELQDMLYRVRVLGIVNYFLWQLTGEQEKEKYQIYCRIETGSLPDAKALWKNILIFKEMHKVSFNEAFSEVLFISRRLGRYPTAYEWEIIRQCGLENAIRLGITA